MSNPSVLKTYRRFLYTLMEVFEGDYVNFHKMRIVIRREIEKNSDIKDEKDIRKKIIEFEEARNTMSQSLIQGKLQEGEFYRFKTRKEHFMGFNTETKGDIDIDNDDHNHNDNIISNNKNI